MKVTRVTTITPESLDTASDLMAALNRCDPGAVPVFVMHSGDRNQSDYVTIELTETVP